MKLHLEQHEGINLITGYGADHLMINKVRHDGNVLVTSDQIIPAWTRASIVELSPADWEQVLALKPEVVLLGTGSRLRFPSPAVLRPLIEARIGYEVMDVAAACRTYNVLVGEGRAVAAAILFD
jgi:uncharacterized protein